MYSLTQATNLLLKSSSDNNNKDIIYYNIWKFRHIFWVLEVWRSILLKIKDNTYLESEIVNKAEICFMLHDIWRFFQNDWEKVLQNKDFEHWDKSYEIVKNNDYSLDICLAIKYHNKFEINWIFEEKEYFEMNDKQKKDTIFLLNILKDADKLQNMIYCIFDFNNFVNFDKTAWKLLENDILEINLNSIQKHKLLKHSNVVSKGDYILCSISFLFDLNFEESMNILSFYSYIEKSISLLENTPWVSKESMEIIRKEVNEINILWQINKN